MYLIKVAFIKEQNQYSLKEYWFKTPIEFNIGAQFKDRRYQELIEITHIEPWTGKKERSIGFVVKTIDSNTIEYFKKVVKIKPNNMEKRNIKVSLEEARNWYNGKDQTLRKLALQAYTEEELNEPQNLKEILEALGIHSLQLNMKLGGKDAASTMKLSKKIGIEIGSELTLHMKLALIAKYFNGTWESDINKTKYFLAKTHYSYDLPNSIQLGNNYCIGTHERVMYPGIVYFQKQEDVKKAYEILKAEG